MASLVVLGATGFLGKSLVANGMRLMPIKAVARNEHSKRNLLTEGVTWFVADLARPEALDSILGQDDVVINLAYASSVTHETENISLIENIFRSCLNKGIRRLVHCSTADVAGATQSSLINESTPCVPVSAYQRMKLAVEERLLSISSGQLDVGVLRPTAMVGPGGQNLIKLANSLQSGNGIMSYLRASVLACRPMHLVPASNVADALIHLSAIPVELNGGVYIAASDDDPDNNFRAVEAILMSSMGLGQRTFPVMPFSRHALSILLRAMGRPDADLARTFNAGKLRATNFRASVSVASAVREFGETLRKGTS